MHDDSEEKKVINLRRRRYAKRFQGVLKCLNKALSKLHFLGKKAQYKRSHYRKPLAH